MNTMTITQTELLDALAGALSTARGPDDARTAAEIMAATGWGERKTRQALAVLASQQRLTVHWVKRPRIDGVMTQVPAYTILPAPKKKRA